MGETETRRVAELIKELDVLVPPERAEVRLRQHGESPDECQIIANPEGYLRFGIEMMKGAFAMTSGDTLGASQKIDVDLDYLITDDSTVYFDWFERVEDPDHLVRFDDEPGILDRAFALGCLLAVIAAAALAAIGGVTVFRWMSG